MTIDFSHIFFSHDVGSKHADEGDSFMFLFMILCLNERCYFIDAVRKCGSSLGVCVRTPPERDTDNHLTTMCVCRTSKPFFLYVK